MVSLSLSLFYERVDTATPGSQGTARMSLLQTESGSSTSRSALLALRDALRSSNAHLRADDAGLERQADALGALLQGLPSFLRGR